MGPRSGVGGLMKRLWKLVYNNEGGQAGGGGQGGEGGNQGAGEGGQGGGGGTNDDDKPTISQKKMNQILTDERKKSQKQTQDYIKQLEDLKQSSQLTAQQKSELESKIEELNSSLLTKDELAKKEREKLVNENKKKEETLTSERDTWKNRYTDAIISRSITDAAVTGDAFSPSQIVSLLRQEARLVEETDAEGKPNGIFTTKIKFKGRDKDNKPVILDLTVEETIKQMKEMTDLYGNLFKSTMSGGLGGKGSGTGGSTGNGQPRPDMSQEEWREWRKKQGLARK